VYTDNFNFALLIKHKHVHGGPQNLSIFSTSNKRKALKLS